MPIRKKWSKFTLKNLLKVPKVPGAYELASKNKSHIDTGGSNTNLRRRLKEKRKARKTATHFRFELPSILQTGFELEGTHSKRYQKKHGRKPKHTKRSPKSIFDFFKW